MSVQDAIRTSVLKRNWRYNWTTVSNLTINGGLDKSSNSKYSHFLHSVTHILLRHRGPINSLNLEIPHLYEKGTESLDTWLLILCAKRVKQFTLLNFHFSLTSFYKLPSHFFSFQEITHLRLYRCTINPPTSFNAFPKLITLELLTVSLEPQSFGYLISSCPLLESFTLDHCNSCDHLIVISKSLRHLLINASIRSLYIDAKNLKTLSTVHTTLHGSTNEIKIILHHPSAEMMSPQIETICLGSYILKFVASGEDISEKLPTPLTCFKKIKFVSFDIGNPTKVASALDLINHSPNLEELKFAGASRRSLGKWDQSTSILGNTQLRLSRLQIAKFSYNRSSTPELKIMMSILAGSPSLKKILVRLTPEKCRHNCVRLWKDLMRSTRSSLEAKIIVFQQLDTEKEVRAWKIQQKLTRKQL